MKLTEYTHAIKHIMQARTHQYYYFKMNIFILKNKFNFYKYKKIIDEQRHGNA
jgi:hypothetical protein